MVILSCLPIFFSGFHYLFAVFILGFVSLILKAVISL